MMRRLLFLEEGLQHDNVFLFALVAQSVGGLGKVGMLL
jgi:hypothetical protein